MSLSQAEIVLLVEELSPHLQDTGVQRVRAADDRTLVLQMRGPGRTLYVLLCTDPEHARLHAVEKPPRQPKQPGAFIMQLRKWLHGALFDTISVTDGDRIVDFTFLAIAPDWEPSADDQAAPRVPVRLIGELTGPLSNLFLVGPDNKVVGQQHGDVVTARRLHPGVPYEPPPPPPPHPAAQTVRWQLTDRDPRALERSQIVAEAYEAIEGRQAREALVRELRSGLKRAIKQLRRRIGHIEQDLERIERAEQYRRWGELLQSAYGKVERGAASARVPDYYAEGMPEVEIPLDPAHDLQWNIDRYFHQYRRYRDAAESVEQRLLQTMETLERAEDARRELEALDELDELEAFKARLQREGILERRRRQPSGRKQQAPAPPFREFRARSGAPILVGRGARHNDALTTAVARGRDIWLHARDWAGAHVVLRMDRDSEPTSEDLIDAATLAAYFSRGKRDTRIDVTYTRAKHVRKPRGAAPGLVTIAGGQTLPIRLDEDRLQRLLETEVAPA